MELANLVISAISNLGFPIVIAGGLFWYIKYTGDKSREERQETEQKHQEEVLSMTESLNNNTIAIQKLITMLEGGNNNA